jgi:ferredoxin-NADP reductase
MYVVVAGLLVFYRILAPIRASLRHRVRVVRLQEEAPGVVSILMKGRHLDELEAQPGQFFRWRFLTRSGWWQSHPFSLSAPVRAPWLRITVKDLGDHSRELHEVHPGTTAFIEGPYGAFTAAKASRSRVLLVAGGVGIAPMRALFETIPAAPGGVTLIYRASTEADLAFRGELDAIAESRGARVHYLVGPRGGPSDPFVGKRLAKGVPHLAMHDVFVCGSPGFTAAATDALQRNGVRASQVHVEDFAF